MSVRSENTLLSPSPWYEPFLKYLTPSEREEVEKLGRLAYQRQQEEGKQIRAEHIRQLVAQIGDLDFHPFNNPKKFGLERVLDAYGFICELKYPNIFYGTDDASFYGCLVKEDKPFSKEDKSLSEREDLLYGNVLYRKKIYIEGMFWYLAVERNYPTPIWKNKYHGNASMSDVSRIALLSKENWKQMKEYVGYEIIWD